MENKPNKNKKQKGFTLIELMVATSLFVAVVLFTMGSLFDLLDKTKNSRALRFAMDNVNFAMESMTRSIRMGTNFLCLDSGLVPTNTALKGDCINGGTLISFVPQNKDYRVSYKLSSRPDETHTLQRCVASVCVDIVSNDVNIKNLKFVVTGSADGDGMQSKAYIMMKGEVLVKDVANSFAVQTLASQRNF